MSMSIADIRKEYAKRSLSEKEVAPDPIEQFKKWWDEAISALIDEVNAMTVATASIDGVPSARTVLLKDFSNAGFVFFTNYSSYKGQQLAKNPKACLLFFWKELERQVRITGSVMQLNAKQNDVYFFSRPLASQIGAIVSPQSRVIESREWLDAQYGEFIKAHGADTVKRPDDWGGYIVNPAIIEFWQGRPSRLHDRLQYTLTVDGGWKIERLAP